MPVKTKPVSGQSSWGNVLNTHLEQLIPNSGGGINTFDIFSDRPIYKAGTSTLLNEDDVGLTYLFTQTGNLHRFTWNTTLNNNTGGGEWKVLNESLINVKDYGAVGDGVVDDTVAIQNTINYASNISVNGYYIVYSCPVVLFPSATYAVTNIVMNSNEKFCQLEGVGSATFLHIGTGACLTIGNGSENGFLSTQVKNITFKRTAKTPGTIGLFNNIAAGGYYENLAFVNFDIGLFNKGGINCIYDFRKRSISGCNIGILVENGPSKILRFSSNLTTFKNINFGGGTINGFLQRTGNNIYPIGTGGNIKIKDCNFEGIDSSGTSIYIENNGEAPGLDTFEIDHCWFEYYGSKLIKLSNAKARMQNCFIAGAASEIIELSNSSSIELNETNGYFLDSSSPTGLISGDFTTCKYNIVACNFSGQKNLTSVYPKVGIKTLKQQTYELNYSSAYPVGNNDYNYNLSLDMFSEANKIFGETWTVATVTFCGNDGTAAVGCLTVQLFKLGAGRQVIDITKVGNGTQYTISGNNITFLNDGSGRWYNMSALYTATNN